MTTKSTASHSAPRDVYLHLLGTITLFITVISLLTVLFQYINVLLPDPLNFFRQGVLDTIRGASSSLLVGFPIFLWISSILHKDVVRDPEKRELGIRKWLTYLTLLVAAIAMIIYMIMLVNGFYGGELTLSFSLKVLSVLLVAGIVFGYYLWDLRATGKPGLLPKQLATGTSVFIIGVLIAGFFIAGSPAQQRKIRFDSQRISDLQSIQNQTIQFWVSKATLPVTLGDLSDTISGFVAPTDPETKQAYEYHVLGNHSFELCATFNLAGGTDAVPGLNMPSTKPVTLDPATGQELVSTDLAGSWGHGVGRACFSRNIDPERYKPQAKTPTS